MTAASRKVKAKAPGCLKDFWSTFSFPLRIPTSVAVLRGAQSPKIPQTISPLIEISTQN